MLVWLKYQKYPFWPAVVRAPPTPSEQSDPLLGSPSFGLGRCFYGFVITGKLGSSEVVGNVIRKMTVDTLT
jgi:hypothetical protein